MIFALTFCFVCPDLKWIQRKQKKYWSYKIGKLICSNLILNFNSDLAGDEVDTQEGSLNEEKG
jgi:hypothetical protein